MYITDAEALDLISEELSFDGDLRMIAGSVRTWKTLPILVGGVGILCDFVLFYCFVLSFLLFSSLRFLRLSFALVRLSDRSSSFW